MRVQQGQGELDDDFVSEFDDGKIQFGFARVTDPQSRLTKFVAINWCGESVPSSRKGLFSVQAVHVARSLKGAHVTIQARSAVCQPSAFNHQTDHSDIGGCRSRHDQKEAL